MKIFLFKSAFRAIVLIGVWTATAPLTCLCGQDGHATDAGLYAISGRVSVQKQGTDEWIVLHGRDAKAYLITGPLREELHKIALEKNGHALVSLQGTLTGEHTASCEHTSTIASGDEGEKIRTTDIRCIKYSYYEAFSIVSVEESDEQLPPLQRDAQIESATARYGNAPPAAFSEVMGEIYGVIKACNTRAAVKTLEIANADAQSPLRSLTVILTSETRITKRIGGADPAPLLPQNLRPGQRVTVVYSRNEFRSKALYITVIRE